MSYKSRDMKFEETFRAYMAGDEARHLNECCHFEYRRLKNDLNICRHHSQIRATDESHGDRDDRGQILPYQCPRCDQKFFSELMTEASKMADCFSVRVGRLVHLHFPPGMQRLLSFFLQYFKDDQQALIHKGWMLIEFVIMNAMALRKILKKYDKVHKSAIGMSFRSKLQAKHLEIMQSPWLIELVAFYMNLNGSNGVKFDKLVGPLSFGLSTTDEGSVLTLMLPDSEIIEQSLMCAICLDNVIDPYALSCGHIFCKSCACSAASVLIIQGLKSACPESKCPVCRESGVYTHAVRMSELGLLLQQRCKEGLKERLAEEREKVLNQTRRYWELQASSMMGL